jgi:hypothetical protein
MAEMKKDAKGRPVKFIRVRGRVVPIPADKYSGQQQPQKQVQKSGSNLAQRDLSKMSLKEYSKFREGAEASVRYKHGDIEKAKKNVTFSKNLRNAGLAVTAASFLLPKTLGKAGLFAIGAAVAGQAGIWESKGSLRMAKDDKKKATKFKKKYGRMTSV